MNCSAGKVFVSVLGTCLVLMLGVVTVTAQEANSGYLKVKSNPGGAGVFVDGNYVGPAKNFGSVRKYKISPGEHEVTLKDSLYKDYETKVTIESGKTATIAAKLEALPAPAPPFGNLRIEGTDKFAAVYLNGKFMGHMDEFNNHWQGLLIKPGEYELKVVGEHGGTPFEQKVTIAENKTTHVKFQ
jgi:PEGA domain